MLAELVQVDTRWLDDLRTLLILGWLILAVWFGVQLRLERPDKPKADRLNAQTAAFCKLHQRPEHLCRDMHDPEP